MIKSRTLSLGLKENYSKNFIIYMMVFLFLLSGFLIGVYLFTYLDSQTVNNLKNDFIEYMNTIKYGNFNIFYTLKTTILSLAIPIVVFVLFSTSIIFSPITLVMLSLKGFTLGFTITFMMTNFSFKGILITILTILIPNALIIFMYVILCVKSISRGICRTRLRNKFLGVDNSISFKFISLFVILSVLISLLFQCVVTPFIIKLIF